MEMEKIIIILSYVLIEERTYQKFDERVDKIINQG